MKVRVELDVPDPAKLVHEALMQGFLREDPRKRWTSNEHKEAIRWLVKRKLRELTS